MTVNMECNSAGNPSSAFVSHHREWWAVLSPHERCIRAWGLRFAQLTLQAETLLTRVWVISWAIDVAGQQLKSRRVVRIA